MARKKKVVAKEEPKIPYFAIDSAQGLIDAWYLNEHTPVAATVVQATLSERYLILTDLEYIEEQLDALKQAKFVKAIKRKKVSFYTPTESLLLSSRILSPELQ